MQEELETLIALSEKEFVSDVEKTAILTLISAVVDKFPETPKSKAKTNFTEDDMKLATWMAERVNKLLGREKKHNLNSWANTIRLMREQDKLTLTEIGSVFDFANRHNFWAKNILSPDKLRKQFDKLLLERGSKSTQVATTKQTKKLSPSEALREKMRNQGRAVNF